MRWVSRPAGFEFGDTDGRADYSAKHGRHGVNIRVATAPAGEVL